MTIPANVLKEEFKEKQKLARDLEKYYLNKAKEVGLKDFDRILKYFPDLSDNTKKGIVFAHNDFEKILEAIANKKPWAVVSGLNPSGPLHFGHKAIFDELLWMQQHGAEIFIPITNDESYVVGKTKSLAEARKIAYEEVIPSIIAFGFDPKKTHIFVDSDYPDIYNVAMDVSTKVTLNKVFGVFGFNKNNRNENPGTMFYRSAVQLAQILLPQYPEFGGPKPTIIPVGIDQHPYILLARDVAEKKKFIPPAEIVTKFLPSLKGPEEKMSAHIKDSCIYLTDEPEEAEKKIKKAYTGGLSSAEYQKKVGGIPEICPIFLLLKYHFLNEIETKKLYDDYKNGKILNKEIKEITIKKVKAYLEKHKKDREKAKKIMNDFLLTTKINSIL
jgi:tryptophanyl-tRNA synthetase